MRKPRAPRTGKRKRREAAPTAVDLSRMCELQSRLRDIFQESDKSYFLKTSRVEYVMYYNLLCKAKRKAQIMYQALCCERF